MSNSGHVDLSPEDKATIDEVMAQDAAEEEAKCQEAWQHYQIRSQQHQQKMLYEHQHWLFYDVVLLLLKYANIEPTYSEHGVIAAVENFFCRFRDPDRDALEDIRRQRLENTTGDTEARLTKRS